MSKPDNVNSPSHYQLPGQIEVIDITSQLDFLTGNAIKYLLRHDKKNADPLLQLEDLRKAEWYIKHKVAQFEAELGEQAGVTADAPIRVCDSCGAPSEGTYCEQCDDRLNDKGLPPQEEEETVEVFSCMSCGEAKEQSEVSWRMEYLEKPCEYTCTACAAAADKDKEEEQAANTAPAIAPASPQETVYCVSCTEEIPAAASAWGSKSTDGFVFKCQSCYDNSK